MGTNETGMLRSVRYFFGIFMVLFYLAVAVLLATNFFGFAFSKWLQWLFAVLFGLYGLYRGYRLVTGQDFYGRRPTTSDDDETRYTTYAEELKKMTESSNDDNNEQVK